MDFMVHLEDLSLQELQQLMDDEEKINEFIMDDEKVKSTKLQREMIMAENRSIADDSLGKEPKLLQLKADLGNKYSRLNTVKELYQTNQGKMASLSKEDNLDAMLAILQAKLAESEERTEKVEERFNSKEIEVTDYIVAYTDVRKVAHLRRAKIDKMKELVLDMRRNEVHRSASLPVAPKPNPRARNTSVPSSNQPTNSTPYPAYPNYGQAGYSQPPRPHQPYPPAPQQNQSYPGYSW